MDIVSAAKLIENHPESVLQVYLTLQCDCPSEVGHYKKV